LSCASEFSHFLDFATHFWVPIIRIATIQASWSGFGAQEVPGADGMVIAHAPSFISWPLAIKGRAGVPGAGVIGRKQRERIICFLSKGYWDTTFRRIGALTRERSLM
jgi:hypothetical protein